MKKNRRLHLINKTVLKNVNCLIEYFIFIYYIFYFQSKLYITISYFYIGQLID